MVLCTLVFSSVQENFSWWATIALIYISSLLYLHVYYICIEMSTRIMKEHKEYVSYKECETNLRNIEEE